MKKIIFLIIACIVSASAKEAVTLQLPWLNQFQFAGYYVAKEKGYYDEAGLDVRILDAANRKSPLKSVIKGEAQYGVGRSSLVVDYAKGTPIILMAAIFQSSPMVLLTRKDANIRSAVDLKGKRIMLTNDTVEGAEMQAMFRSVGVSLSDLKLIGHSYDPKSLESNETDAMVAYLSNEPYRLKQMGVETYAIDPKEYGFDYYSDILFTTQNEVALHPERAKAFYDASMRGWLWAFEHIDETAEIIYRYYNPQKKTRDQLIFEGKTLKSLAFRPNIAFGMIDPMRLEMIAQGYRLMGVIQSVPRFETIVYKHGFLGLTKEEKEWLRAHPIIRVGIDHNWPPIESVDENGNHFGVGASYLKLLEKKLGIRFEIDYSRQRWSDSLDALKLKQIDMLSCAAITPERKEYIAFSRPYLKQSIVIVTSSNVGYVNDINDLDGKKVAVVRSYMTEEYLRSFHPNIVLVPVKSSLEALNLVAAGKVYACVDGLAVVSYLMEQNNLKKLKVAGETPYRYELAFAFRKDWEILSRISDKALASITPSEYHALHSQWMMLDRGEPVNYRLVWGGIGFGALIFILIAYKNRQLDVLVRKRTEELKEFNEKLQDEIEKAVAKNRKQEKLLMQQAKMAEIGSMLESIAHQWRQPLNILGLSMTRLNLSCSIEGKEDASKVIEIAENQIRYMSETIDDFRNFFKQDKASAEVNILELVKEVEALLSPVLIRKKITLELDIDPTIQANVFPNELKQVLINLLNNASEAIDLHRGERLIRIECEREDGQCIIRVQDTGGGIPEGIIDKIFDPYFTTKFESQGTGIGLYMAKMIIEKHFQGRLSVYNTLSGACFEIRLNRIVEEENCTGVQNDADPQHNGE